MARYPVVLERLLIAEMVRILEEVTAPGDETRVT
jgi:hypothetical protein